MMIIHSYVKIPEGMISQTQVEDDRKLSSQDNDSTQIQDGSRILLPSWFKTIATYSNNRVWVLIIILTLWETYKKLWNITISTGKLTISWPLSSSLCSKSYQRWGSKPPYNWAPRRPRDFLLPLFALCSYNDFLTLKPKHWSRLPPVKNPSTIQLSTS